MESVDTLVTERLLVLLNSFLIFSAFFLIAWKNGYFDFSRQSNVELESVTIWQLLTIFGLFLGLQLIIVPFTFEAWLQMYHKTSLRKGISSSIQGLFNLYAIFLSFIGVFLYVRTRSDSLKNRIWGPFAFRSLTDYFQDLKIACFSWLLSYPLVVCIGQIISLVILFFYKSIEPEQVAVQQIKLAASSPGIFAVLIFAVVFVVPIVEELLFRGFLQNWLKNHMKTWQAILLASFIFALFHFASTQGVGNVELLVSLFVLSCFLGFIYERQKSLLASISMHGLFNGISIILIFVFDKG